MGDDNQNPLKRLKYIKSLAKIIKPHIMGNDKIISIFRDLEYQLTHLEFLLSLKPIKIDKNDDSK